LISKYEKVAPKVNKLQKAPKKKGIKDLKSAQRRIKKWKINSKLKKNCPNVKRSLPKKKVVIKTLKSSQKIVQKCKKTISH
jgi:hypothetical protein